MKLFLTSAGLTTPELKHDFCSLVRSGGYTRHITYITTATNPEHDKSYQTKNIEQLKNLSDFTLETVDITTPGYISALERAGVIWFGGGNTFYLLDCINKEALKHSLVSLLSSRIYAGSSAGSIVATPTIEVAFVEPADNNYLNITDFTGLSLTPFEVAPHTPDICTMENTATYARRAKHPVYSISDNSAVLFDTESKQATCIGDGVILLD